MLGVRYFPEVDFLGVRLFPVLLDASPVVTFRNLVPAVHLDGGIQFVQQAVGDVPEQVLRGRVYVGGLKTDEYLGRGFI